MVLPFMFVGQSDFTAAHNIAEFDIFAIDRKPIFCYNERVEVY